MVDSCGVIRREASIMLARIIANCRLSSIARFRYEALIIKGLLAGTKRPYHLSGAHHDRLTPGVVRIDRRV